MRILLQLFVSDTPIHLDESDFRELLVFIMVHIRIYVCSMHQHFNVRNNKTIDITTSKYTEYAKKIDKQR